MKIRKRIGTVLLGALVLLAWGCAKEGARTDIELEMTDEDSVEALIDQDLLTAGGTIVNIDESAGTRGSQSTVSYVDEVEVQRPVLVETDQSLKPPDAEAPFDAMMVVSDESILPPPVESTAIEPPVFEPAFPEDTDTALAAQAAQPAFEPPPAGTLPDVDSLLDEAEAMDVAAVDTTVEGLVPPPSPMEQPGEASGTPGGIQPAAVRSPGGAFYSTPYATTTPPVVYPRHTVVQGDTLWSISKKYGVSISELCAANNVSRRDILRIGQTLVIPRKDEGRAPAAVPAAEATPQVSAPVPAEPAPAATDVASMATEYYTVQQGDSYWKIARQYGLSANELMALNDTSDSMIRVGQKILVPKR